MGIHTKSNKIMQIIAHTVLFIVSALAVIPFWLLIASSLSDAFDVTKSGYQFIPKNISFEAYQYIFQEWTQIGRAYGVTVLVSVLGTVLSVIMVSMLAYGLIQKDIKGVNAVFIFVLITMLFNGGVVPTYLVYNNLLKVKNTIWGLILPNLLMSGFTVILVKNYFQQSIPEELIEAAKIDGCGHFRIYFKMILPLSKPILATVGLLSAVSYWNDWTNGLYYVTDEKLYSIQLLLNKMNENILFMANNSQNMMGVDMSNMPSATIRMAIAVVAILPIIIAYPFFHKYFAKGLTMGAVKG
ncbi:putative aldouronate transport system permease protein [Lachnotalea glycerini]|nr:carbohydrate ABC transporter permease [Lachnotalea glycerini]PXV89449.1 putative aldouronate transport system permease protein [Lachnotalea glycerini]